MNAPPRPAPQSPEKTATPLVSLRGVRKRFGKTIAVEALDLTVPPGQIFGLLGHNGAGKSTTIGMLLGQIYPDAGEIKIQGRDVFANRHNALARVGAIFETPAFYDYLSGATNLRILGKYSGPVNPRRMMEVVRLVGLENRLHDPVRTYSHGMRQRLALAQALLPDPELLILDEPGDGLDPEGIREMRELILKLNREWGLAILFSSHLLSEVEQLCTHVAVMREGRLLFAGEWRPMEGGTRWIQVKVDRQAEAETGLVRDGLLTGFHPGGRGRLANGRSIPEISAWLVNQGYRLELIAPGEATLEDFYLALMRS